LLIIGDDLKRESLVMFERGTAVEAETWDAGDRGFYRQHVALLAGWIATGRAVDGTHGSEQPYTKAELDRYAVSAVNAFLAAYSVKTKAAVKSPR
jgi:hypothetical protein